MWRRPVETILMLAIALILTLPLRAQQKSVAPTLRSAHAGLKPGATSEAAVSDRRPTIGDRRYNRGICRCDSD
jgi:hypothetical protein